MLSPPPHLRAHTPPPDYYNDLLRQGFGFWENPNPGWVQDTQGNPCPFVDYVTEGASPRAFIQKNAKITFVLASVDTSVITLDTLRSLDMSFTGELFQAPDAIAYEQRGEHLNFYLPHCGPNGTTNVRGYNRIIYPNIYPHIDLWVYCGQRGQKMAIVIHPGASPSDVQLTFDGQNEMDLDVFGNLKLLLDERWIVLPEAVAYQYDESNTILPVSWTAEYVPNENTGVVGFTFDAYDEEKPLVLLIGPPPMAMPPGSGTPPCWSTYVAGNNVDAANANGVDADGNSYVAGVTSTLFNTFPGNAGGTFNAATGTAYFVSKFSPLYELLWTSYYGGNGGYQEPWAMAVKNSQAGPGIYVVGQTSSDDQYTVAPPGAFIDSTSALSAQGCIAKFNEIGELTWATYFGDAQTTIHGAAIDSHNNLVITGTSSGGLPVPDVQPQGATYFAHGVGSDAFVAQFDENDGLRWSTYLPGSSTDHGKSIKPLLGGLVVCGYTISPDFPLVDYGGNAYFRDTLQGGETYVAIFNGADSLVSSTYFGGSGADDTGFGRNALEVDAIGNIYLIGTTTSPDLPVEQGGGWCNPEPTNGFIVQFLKTTYSIAWMTYVGDSAASVTPSAITSDEDGNIYVVGETQNYPIAPVELPGMYYQPEPNSASADYLQWVGCYIQAFTDDHELIWSTYFDGVEGWQWPEERINAVAWHQDRLYIAGAHGKDLADSLSFFPLFDPGDPAWFDGSFNGLRDAFAAAFCTNPFTSVHEHAPGDIEQVNAIPLGPDNWTIVGLPDGRYRIALYDAAGRLVLTTTLISQNGRSTELNTSNCSTAIYTGLLSGSRAAYVRLPVLR